MCSTDLSYITSGKVYTQKDSVLLETFISEIHNKYYIPAIQNWHFIYHMCVFLERMTAVNNAARHWTVRSNNMMFYAHVIIQSR